jgi:hypothetical protein
MCTRRIFPTGTFELSCSTSSIVTNRRRIKEYVADDAGLP